MDNGPNYLGSIHRTKTEELLVVGAFDCRKCSQCHTWKNRFHGMDLEGMQ